MTAMERAIVEAVLEAGEPFGVEAETLLWKWLPRPLYRAWASIRTKADRLEFLRRLLSDSPEEDRTMHDRNGNPLAKGDKVTISAVITELHGGEDYCNVSLETEHGRRPDGQKEHIQAINTGVLDKVVASLLMLFALSGNFVRADDFADRIAQIEALSVKKGCTCACSSPADCTCAPGTCVCAGCLSKAKAKPVAPVVLANPPKADFRHDCGCPVLQCNCGGNCHCAENRAENRQPMRWRQEDGSGHNCAWSLWRGNRQVGGIDVGGNYRPLVGDSWGEPCKLPIPLPQKQVAIQVASSGRSC